MDEEHAVAFADQWIEQHKANGKPERLPRARDDNESDLLPDVLVIQKPNYTKRFKPTERVTHIYSDYVEEAHKPRADYNEYCDLWRDFVGALTYLRGRDKRVAVGEGQYVYPITEERIGRLKRDENRLEDIDMEKSTTTDADKLYALDLEAKAIRLKYSSFKDLKECKLKYERELDVLKETWDAMDKTINALVKNRYVQGRNHDNKANLRDYRDALYAMVLE